MTAPIIGFEQVWKKFRRGERHDSLRDVISALGRRIVRPKAGEGLRDQEFWVLRDVSFSVQAGEALGIIGPNGAGKSTTLKLLTKILRPNRGSCFVHGRVGALIEVTAGFHHDLTGRENIYLQGAIMGMKRAEIARKFDEIVDFAGLGAFIDTPVKRYSSGMGARLGFSIAAHLNPQALIIDEVLAVGDVAFQQRCYERIKAFKRDGVAVVFVSHNFAAVSQVCDRVAVLSSGSLRVFDSAFDGISSYSAQALAASGDAQAVKQVQILNEQNEPLDSVQAGQSFQIRAVLRPDAGGSPLSSSILLRRVETGEIVYSTSAVSLGNDTVSPAADSVVTVTWRMNANMARGHYVAEMSLFDVVRRWPVVEASSSPFAVEEQETESATLWLGACCSLKVDSRVAAAEASAPTDGKSDPRFEEVAVQGCK